MRSWLVFTVALTASSVAFADKEDDCRDECKALTDADLKAACLKWIEPFRRDNGCLGGKFTDASCCTERRELLKKLQADAATACGKGSEAKKCLDPFYSVCLASLPDKVDKFEKCVKKEVLVPAQGSQMAAQCDKLPEPDRAICTELGAYAAKDEWSPDDVAKAIKRLGEYWALCDTAFERGVCEKAHVGCHDKWKSQRFDFHYTVTDCYKAAAGRYAECMSEIEKQFREDDKSDVVNYCQKSANDDKLSAAEKAKIKEVCDNKIQLLTAKAAVDEAARNLTSTLLPKIEQNYKLSLEKKAVLGMTTAELKRHAEQCHEALKTVQDGRKLSDADKLTIHIAYKDREITIAEARAICQWPVDNLETFAKVIKEERAKDAAKTIKEFCDQHGCKGKALKSTIELLAQGESIKVGQGDVEGTPSRVSKKGGQIYWSWIYKGSNDIITCSCDHIVFDGGGSKVVKKYADRCRCAE